MAKQAVIEQDGVIVESLSNAMFRVELEIGQKIICNISGKMRMHYIKILPGDKVKVEMTYQAVDYLESSGTQYIDTGVSVDTALNSDVFSIEAQVSSSSISNGSRKFMFGFNNPSYSHYAEFDEAGHFGCYNCYTSGTYSSNRKYNVEMKIINTSVFF